MKRNRFFTAIGLITAVWFSACTNDEPMNPNALPEGKYPLEIASVTMSVESSSEPWGADAPQTRVAESENGNSSVWEWNGTERIGVQLYADDDDDVATYTLNADNTLTPDKTLYWENKEQTTVMAWYPVETEVSLANQKDKLAYVLKGSGTGTYQDKVSLSFSHALAKVRVLLNGSQAENVKNVQIKSYTSCTNTQGSISTDGANEDWITMKPCTYNGTKCWEANVVPSAITQFKVNEREGTFKNDGIIPMAAKVNTIIINVKSVVPEDAKDITGNISDNSNYVVRGTRNEAINITGGSPHIYLDGADISASTPIRITGNSTATIHVTGGNNAVTSTSGTGILVEKGSTLIITSENTDNVITVRGKYNLSNDYPGIGGNESGDCGTIRIENVTVHAYGNGTFACAPGIGPSQNYSCEGIIIEEAVVYAFGTGSDNLAAPGIGSGMHNISAEIGAIPKIEITHSTIHAVRGGVVADYIGRAGWRSDSASSEVNPGTGGSIKSSTVYCYTGDTYRLDKTMMYDAFGNAMEQ